MSLRENNITMRNLMVNKAKRHCREPCLRDILSPMQKATKDRPRICLIFTQSNRADRARLSGVLRFAVSQSNWDIRMLDRSSSTFSADAISLTHSWMPDGIIYTADSGSDEALSLVATRAAVVVALDPPENISTKHASIVVMASPDEIAGRVSDLLLRRGFSNFGYYGTEIPDERDYSLVTERHFLQTLKRQKHVCAIYREESGVSWSERLASAAEWVKDLPKPCGVLAYSDDLARNLLDACRLAGAAVPDQVAIIGVDDSPEVCESCRPTISSVRLDFERSGYLAAQSLHRRLSHSTKGRNAYFRRIRYGVSTITERASTQDLRGCGRIVSAANELLRTLPLDRLHVCEIASLLNVSRRILEIHFKTVIGKTMQNEITRRRLAAIQDRLQNSSETITAIVFSCGYKTLNSARIAYRKFYGHTMSSERARASQGHA